VSADRFVEWRPIHGFVLSVRRRRRDPAHPRDRKASEGFGTCYTCNAHACQIHGDSVQGQTYFRCADCLTRLGLIKALTRTPPAGAPAAPTDPATQRMLESIQNFEALAPGVIAAAAPLAAGVDDEAMKAALADVLRTVHIPSGGVGIRDIDRWIDTEPRTRRRALGLPPIADYDDVVQRHDTQLGINVIQLAAATLTAEAEEWNLRSSDDVPSHLALLAAWALGTAYAARGARSLETGPFQLPGGLRLPPIALLTAISYENLRPR
jgi:hypothetical protein